MPCFYPEYTAKNGTSFPRICHVFYKLTEDKPFTRVDYFDDNEEAETAAK
jgi:hypothetical protein